MAIESPLFQSSMELLGHSFSHFNGTKELDRKLLILHLANAIELILKDLVLDLGESIYKGPKETITVYGCIKILLDKGTDIPFLNKIELLIDERNALQHRYGSPNELTAIFYMNIVQEFFKEVLKNNYDQEYDKLITQFTEEHDLATYKLGEPTNDQELEKLHILGKLHPLGALLAAWSYFEKVADKFITDAGLDYRRKRPIVIDIIKFGLQRFGLSVPVELRSKIDEIRQIRNMAAHGQSEPSKSQVKKAIDTIKEFEEYLLSIDVNVIKEEDNMKTTESVEKK